MGFGVVKIVGNNVVLIDDNLSNDKKIHAFVKSKKERKGFVDSMDDVNGIHPEISKNDFLNSSKNVSCSVEIKSSLLANILIMDKKGLIVSDNVMGNRELYRKDIIKPKSIASEERASQFFDETVDYIIDKYNNLLWRMTDYMKKKYLRISFSNLSDEEYKKKIERHVFEAVSPALLLGMRTDYVVTSDLYDVSNLAVRSLSSGVDEVKEIGICLKKVLSEKYPLLAEDLKKSEYHNETNEVLGKFLQRFIGYNNMIIEENSSGAKLVVGNKGTEDEVISAIIYKYSDLSYMSVREIVTGLSVDKKDEIIAQALSRMKEKDSPIREISYPYFTFEVIVDNNTYMKLRKVISSTTTLQKNSVKYGYDVPEIISNAMCDDLYRDIMSRANTAYQSMKGRYLEDADYLVPLGYKRRVLLKMDFREIFVFVRDTTFGKNSYEHKRIARQIYTELKDYYPALAKHLKVNME